MQIHANYEEKSKKPRYRPRKKQILTFFPFQNSHLSCLRLYDVLSAILILVCKSSLSEVLFQFSKVRISLFSSVCYTCSTLRIWRCFWPCFLDSASYLYQIFTHRTTHIKIISFFRPSIHLYKVGSCQ